MTGIFGILESSATQRYQDVSRVFFFFFIVTSIVCLGPPLSFADVTSPLSPSQCFQTTSMWSPAGRLLPFVRHEIPSRQGARPGRGGLAEQREGAPQPAPRPVLGPLGLPRPALRQVGSAEAAQHAARVPARRVRRAGQHASGLERERRRGGARRRPGVEADVAVGHGEARRVEGEKSFNFTRRIICLRFWADYFNVSQSLVQSLFAIFVNQTWLEPLTINASVLHHTSLIYLITHYREST